jgi:spermidine synthase
VDPRETLSEARTPEGDVITLAREGGGAYVVRVRGAVLMSSRMHGSEEGLAEVGCAGLRSRSGARVLVGGLGLGYTLRATLDALGAHAQVIVCELIPAVVTWNRGVLGPLANHPLADPRVVLREGDVCTVVRSSRASFDAILLDVDNGPQAMTSPGNAWLYRPEGIRTLRAALRAGGRVVVWSVSRADRFLKDLTRGGFDAEIVTVSARGAVKRGGRHALYVGRVPA